MQDRFGVWEYDPEAALIRRRQVHGKDTIGDIRISYHVPKPYQNGATV